MNSTQWWDNIYANTSIPVLLKDWNIMPQRFEQCTLEGQKLKPDRQLNNQPCCLVNTALQLHNNVVYAGVIKCEMTQSMKTKSYTLQKAIKWPCLFQPYLVNIPKSNLQNLWYWLHLVIIEVFFDISVIIKAFLDISMTATICATPNTQGLENCKYLKSIQYIVWSEKGFCKANILVVLVRVVHIIRWYASKISILGKYFQLVNYLYCHWNKYIPKQNNFSTLSLTLLTKIAIHVYIIQIILYFKYFRFNIFQ